MNTRPLENRLTLLVREAHELSGLPINQLEDAIKTRRLPLITSAPHDRRVARCDLDDFIQVLRNQ